MARAWEDSTPSSKRPGTDKHELRPVHNDETDCRHRPMAKVDGTWRAAHGPCAGRKPSCSARPSFNPFALLFDFLCCGLSVREKW